MTTYGVRSPGEEECFLTMEAASPDSRPYNFKARAGSEYLVNYAEELVKTRGASARGVASRMGAYNEFVEIDGGVSKEAPTFANSDERIDYILNKGIEQSRRRRIEKNAELDLRGEGDTVKADDE